MDSLAGIRAKLDRGKEHRDCLYDEIQRVLDENPVAADFVQDVDLPALPPKIAGLPRIVSTTLTITQAAEFTTHHGILLGESIHAFRSSLDHLAWLLVKRGAHRKLTAKEAQLVQFPMARNRRGFWANKTRLPGVPDKPHRAIIERYQPYRRSDIGKTMRCLRDLSNTDKHRVILPTLVAPGNMYLAVNVQGAAAWTHRVLYDPESLQIKRGAKLIQVLFGGGGTGERDVRMQGHITSLPALPGGIRLEPMLNRIAATCTEIVDVFEPILN